MSHLRRIWTIVLLLAAATALRPAAVPAAQQPPEAPRDEAAAKQQILESPAWNEIMEGLREWLSVQIVYNEQQVSRLRAEFDDKVTKMSAVELAEYAQDLQRKLAIITSKEGFEARQWAEDYMNALSKPRAEQFREELPDVFHMTAAQLQQALVDLQRRRAERQASQKAFEQTRDEQVKAFRAMQKETANASARAMARMPSGGAHPGFYGGSYSPRNNYRGGYQPSRPVYGGWGWRW